MRNVRTTLLLFVLARPLLAQGAPPQVTADEPYTMEYYYKVQWGHQREFLRLSLKNHYSLLRKGVESGRMISVKIETPANHMTEDARWDYCVTIKFKNSPWRRRRIRKRNPGSVSSGLTRRRTNVRNNGGSRSCSRTGICR